MQAIDLITDAARLANIINEVETPSAELGAQGRTRLNQLLSRLDADEYDVGAVPITANADEVTVLAGVLWALTVLLARDLALFNGVPVTPELAEQVSEAERFLGRQSMQPVEADPSDLPQGTVHGSYTITG